MILTLYILLFLSLWSYVGWCIFKRMLKAALIAQEERLKKESEEKFAQMINEFNHEGPVPPGASLIGLAGLISWATLNCIKEFEKHLLNKDWNIQAPLTELRMIWSNEMKRMRSVVEEWLNKRREILERYNKEQGL